MGKADTGDTQQKDNEQGAPSEISQVEQTVPVVQARSEMELESSEDTMAKARQSDAERYTSKAFILIFP